MGRKIAKEHINENIYMLKTVLLAAVGIITRKQHNFWMSK